MQVEPGALHGVTVIDFTHVLAGPACSYFLALLGARVIKVESANRGDAMRHRGGSDKTRIADGMSTHYLAQGAGKELVVVNLERPADRERFAALLSKGDVLVENHLPHTMERLGFSDASIAAINPRLIHCAMTGYGRKGERKNAPAYDINIQAASGLMALTGTSETGPTRVGAPVMDYATALSAALAVSAALYRRKETGRGTLIDVSMLATAHSLMSSTVTDYLLTGKEPLPRGNSANSNSPSSGVFACREGLLSLGVNEEHQFEAFATVVGCPFWLSDARFATAAARDVHRGDMSAEILGALAKRSAHEWEPIMQAADVPAARVRTLAESLADFVGEPARLNGVLGPERQLPLPFDMEGARQPGTLTPAPEHSLLPNRSTR